MGERGPAPGEAYGAAAVSKCIHGTSFPISKNDLLSRYGNCQVEWRKGESMKLRDLFEGVTDETFNSPVDIEKALKEKM